MMNFTDLDNAVDPLSGETRRVANTKDVEPRQTGSTWNAGDSSTPGADGPGFDDNLFEYEYMPTPLNPMRIEKFRVENLLLTASILISFVFTIAALATPIVKYSDKTVKMEASVFRLHGCIYPALSGISFFANTESDCENYGLFDVFCRGFQHSVLGFFVTGLFTILSGFVAFIFACFLSCGCVLLWRHLTFLLSLLQLICLFIATICSSAVLTNRGCQHTSLKNIGFKYGPSFPLVLTAFILQALTTVFYIVKRCLSPAKYRTKNY